MRCVLVHYHELALKGRNRPYFEGRLVRHLRVLLKDLGVKQVESLPGRIRITVPEPVAWPSVRDRLKRTFGISNFLLAHSIPLEGDRASLLDPLKQAVGEAVRPLAFKTFRVSAKRADKRLSLTSMDVERDVGTYVRELTGKSVNLSSPELNIRIETMYRDAYYSVDREHGPGGLPIGVSGKVGCLLSGGIDSPVAAYRLMQRGCKAVFVHFHGRPYVTRASEEKVREIVELLTQYQLHSRLYLVPFGDIQRQIVLGAPAAFRVVLYRRMMLRIAEELARKERCWGLVTGDSLGQVASQTPQNLSVVGAAAQLPVLRPLIGMDKLEITLQAQAIGTFETSIEPDQDCCRLFVPAHPSTRTSEDQIQRIERQLDIATFVKQGTTSAELAEFQFPPRVATGR
jgi:thiamine biosynthesis protein ThiI